MSEWTQQDAERLAKAQHNLMGQHPAGPDLSMEDYIQNADVLRNQLIAANKGRKALKALQDRNLELEGKLSEHETLLARAADVIDDLDAEIKSLRAQLETKRGKTRKAQKDADAS